MNPRKVPRTFSGQDSTSLALAGNGGRTVDRILVIDDDEEVQQAVHRTLEPAGYEIVAAVDGGVAMEIFRATMPGLIVLDLRLPGKSGQDLCREIRNESTNVPILVLSAVNEEAEKIHLLDLGADDYMTKPFSPRELLARVRAAMHCYGEGIARV
jgi:DNA-binding response OmpR family regulator